MKIDNLFYFNTFFIKASIIFIFINIGLNILIIVRKIFNNSYWIEGIKIFILSIL